MSRIEQLAEGRVVLHCGDCLDVMAQLAENSLDACICDPPYHLTSIVKRFGAENAAPAQFGKDGAFARASRGFMSKTWDGGDIAFRVETWREVYRVLKPGAYIVAFGGSRTYHRMASAIEDAGFEIRDTLSWIFGSGFPKSLDVSKAIDRMEGAEREVVGYKDNKDRSSAIHGSGQLIGGDDPITAPATDAARQWEGWGTALKPACELIVLARKPLSEGTVAANVLKWGTGALNIDGTRIKATDHNDYGRSNANASGTINQHNGFDGKSFKIGERKGNDYASTLGRWPANVVHDGSPEVLAALPDAPGQQRYVGPEHGMRDSVNCYGDYGGRPPTQPRGDSGSAARFFGAFPEAGNGREFRCDLCKMLYDPASCNANTAESNSQTENTQSGDFALFDVADLPSLGSAGSASRLNGHASNAASHSSPCHQPNANSVQSNAPIWDVSKIVQNVRSAANLCSSCATAIARALAALRLHRSVEEALSLASINEHKKHILIQHLALYAAGRESTDIILTIPSLKILLGFALRAIEDTTNSGKRKNLENIDSAPSRLRYSSKADADDRIGSRHPTVKPLDLMQWLVRLVCPKGATVIDPFAGTGTTGEAAWREGMRAVLIEREAEYQADIRRRMALVMAGPDERVRESVKANGKAQGVDDLPLFGAR